jgi:hypothetical protein
MTLVLLDRTDMKIMKIIKIVQNLVAIDAYIGRFR